MGYLDDNLPQRKDQVVECPKLYTLILRVRARPPFEAMVAGESDDTIGHIVASVVPDVQDWQFIGRREGFVEFAFHIPSQRDRARQELIFNSYYTEYKVI
jgi:hypothetical protein